MSSTIHPLKRSTDLPHHPAKKAAETTAVPRAKPAARTGVVAKVTAAASGLSSSSTLDKSLPRVSAGKVVHVPSRYALSTKKDPSTAEKVEQATKPLKKPANTTTIKPSPTAENLQRVPSRPISAPRNIKPNIPAPTPRKPISKPHAKKPAALTSSKPTPGPTTPAEIKGT